MDQQQQFVEALLRYEVLKFGDFTTKSGRASPYFFNTGNFNSGESMALVASLYAEAILQRLGVQPAYYLFGPAYKGIPLAVMIADRLQQLSKRQAYFTFNRKEAKDHGEKGGLVGYQFKGGEDVIIVEDVLTGGTSIRESLPVLERAKVRAKAVFIGVDRCERGLLGGFSARTEIEQEFRLPVYSLVTIHEIIALLREKELLGKAWLSPTTEAQVQGYLAHYGAS